VCKLESRDSGKCPVVDSCEHGNELSVSIKGGKFIDLLSDYKLLDKDSAPWLSIFYGASNRSVKV
jgi:hypothetical protein